MPAPPQPGSDLHASWQVIIPPPPVCSSLLHCTNTNQASPTSSSHALSLQSRPFLKRWALRAALSLIDCPSMFRHLQARGVRVTMWTLNRQEDVKYWMGRGADSFMTDEAALCSAHTRSRLQ